MNYRHNMIYNSYPVRIIVNTLKSSDVRKYFGPIAHISRPYNRESLQNLNVKLNAAPLVRRIQRPNNRQPQQIFSKLESLSRMYASFGAELDFHMKADETLEEIQDLLETAIEDIEEVVLASGVLTFETPGGTWVINKQTPNKQIWWSSPMSGPRRYEYDSESDRWLNTRDGSCLLDLLTKEMSEVYGDDFDV